MALDWQKFVTEPEPGIIEFILKPEHVKLLRHAKIEWNDTDYGGAAFNAARPYGSQQLFASMATVLEIPYERTQVFYDNLTQLHQETAVALQVILKTGKFKATTYRCDKFTQDWREYNPTARKPKPKQEEMELV